MGLTQEEYERLPQSEKDSLVRTVEKTYKEAGADVVIRNMSELLEVLGID